MLQIGARTAVGKHGRGAAAARLAIQGDLGRGFVVLLWVLTRLLRLGLAVQKPPEATPSPDFSGHGQKRTPV